MCDGDGSGKSWRLEAGPGQSAHSPAATAGTRRRTKVSIAVISATAGMAITQPGQQRLTGQPAPSAKTTPWGNCATGPARRWRGLSQSGRDARPAAQRAQSAATATASPGNSRLEWQGRLSPKASASAAHSTVGMPTTGMQPMAKAQRKRQRQPPGRDALPQPHDRLPLYRFHGLRCHCSMVPGKGASGQFFAGVAAEV